MGNEAERRDRLGLDIWGEVANEGAPGSHLSQAGTPPAMAVPRA